MQLTTPSCLGLRSKGAPLGSKAPCLPYQRWLRGSSLCSPPTQRAALPKAGSKLSPQGPLFLALYPWEPWVIPEIFSGSENTQQWFSSWVPPWSWCVQSRKCRPTCLSSSDRSAGSNVLLDILLGMLPQTEPLPTRKGVFSSWNLQFHRPSCSLQ